MKKGKYGETRRRWFINNCFGHVDSTLLMSPYGMITSLINHSAKKPNARIVWAEDTMPHPEWMNKPVSALEKEPHAGLSFDVIALQDIYEGMRF